MNDTRNDWSQGLVLAVESISEVVFVTQLDGTIIYTNPSFEKVYGFTREESIGKTPRILKSGKQNRDYYKAFWETILSGKTHRDQQINKRRDGELIKVDATVNAMLDTQGRTTGFVALHRDITREQEEQERARRNEQRLAEAQGIAHFGNWERNLHTGEAWWSAEMYRIFGLEPQQFGVSHDRFLDYVHPEDRKWVNQTLENALARDESYRFDYRVIRPSGEERMVYSQARVYRDQEGNPVRLVGATVDITERKRAEKALQESEQRHRSVVQSATSAIIVIDEEMRIISWNPSARPMFGYDEQEVKGIQFTRMLPERHREGFLKRIESHCSNPNDGCGLMGQRIELHGLKKDGSEFPAEMFQSCWQTETGRNFSTVIRDLSEEEKLKEQLLQSQKMESIGILAGGVAHDFNNILTGINGLASLALDGLESGSQLVDDLKQIRELGDRAAGLTRQLLAFSRQQALNPKQLSLNTLIGNLSTMLARMIGEDIEISFRPSSDPDTVRADPGQIEQVLMNLAVNARDAMPQGGVLTMKTHRIDLDRESWAATGTIQPGAYVMLAVTDTGCGMDEQTRRHIFDPFFTTKGVGEGTGLGLSTVHGIVSQHDGHIAVESRKGQGTTFKIYLPFVVGRAEELVLEGKPQCQSRGEKTVLVVEDEASVKNIIERTLKGRGYQVISADSCQEARSLLSRNGRKVDLLLTDIVMPGGGGPELYQEVIGKYPALKVLFISGYTKKGAIRAQVLEPGFPFLQKPFEPDVLACKVGEVLGPGDTLGNGLETEGELHASPIREAMNRQTRPA